MTRPRRLYFDESLQKFYYIIKKKRVFIKVPKGVTQKQVQKVNIKNIVNIPETRRIKRRKKRVNPKFQRVPQKNLLSLLTRQNEGGLPYFIFKEQQQFPTLDELSKKKVVKQEPIIKTEPEFTAMKQESVTPMKPEPKTSKGSRIKTEPELRAMKPEPVTPMKPEPKTSKGSRFNPINVDTPLGTTRKRLSSVFNVFKRNRVAPVEIAQMPSENVDRIVLSPTTDRAVRSIQTDDALANALASLTIKPVKGKGVTNTDDGLYNDQIEKILKKEKCWMIS